jgi:hypothetical protein
VQIVAGLDVYESILFSPLMTFPFALNFVNRIPYRPPNR